MKRYILDITMAAGLVLAMLLGSFHGFARECEDVRTKVLRLHIPANSDSAYDQEIKLLLRDHLLTKYGRTLSESTDISAAKQHAEELLPEIQQTCCDFLTEHGAGYTAKAELCDMYFTTRVYENVTLPAGTYTALRITLGSGKGQNWWCVMFPPLCIPAAADLHEKAEKSMPDVLVSDDDNIKIEIRFALFEFFKWLLG